MVQCHVYGRHPLFSINVLIGQFSSKCMARFKYSHYKRKGYNKNTTFFISDSQWLLVLVLHATRRSIQIGVRSNTKSSSHFVSFSSSSSAKPVQDVDVVFAISATATDAQQTFSIMKDVIKSIFEKHGVESIRPAIIVFGDAASVRLSFDEKIPDLFELKQRIDNLPRNTGTPDLDAALLEAKAVFAGGRPNAKKVLVIISDDKSDTKTWDIREKARELEEEEIEVVPVGIGSEVDIKQLENTTPHKDNVITADKDEDTDQIAEEIVEKILRSKW